MQLGKLYKLFTLKGNLDLLSEIQHLVCVPIKAIIGKKIDTFSTVLEFLQSLCSSIYMHIEALLASLYATQII